MDTKAIKVLLLLLALLTACQPRSGWQVDQIDATEERFSSCRLFSKTQDPLHGVDVEIIRNAASLNTYLSVHSRHLVASKEDPTLISIAIKAEDKTQKFTAHLLEGGQKCLLSQEGTQFLVDCLNSNREIIILLTGYRRSLSPRSFGKQYRAFKHPSSWEIPFQFKL